MAIYLPYFTSKEGVQKCLMLFICSDHGSLLLSGRIREQEQDHGSRQFSTIAHITLKPHGYMPT